MLMIKDTIISHIRIVESDETRWVIQTNAEHLEGVASLAELYANEFGMGSLGRIMGLLHDKGKEKLEFQQYIRDVNGIPGCKNYTQKGKSHAYVGALMLKKYYPFIAPLCENPVMGHHTGLYDKGGLQEKENQSIPADVTPCEIDYKPDLPVWMRKGILAPKDFHHIVRMLFSCLVDADFIDTERFMNPASSDARGNKKSLTQLKSSLEQFLTKLSCAKETPVNKLRQSIQERCKLMAEGEKGFYSLTVPTGGGKTISSLVWAINHALHNGQKRIIIAIPYTSIIVQTAAVLKHIFGEENVLEHHSNTDPEKIKDDSLRHKMRLAMENWDYPIIVTTNVQLFESMFSSKPSSCRRLHNICNSVIILDEVQTLPTDFLQPIVDSLQTYHKIFGVSVLLTTASQPILSGVIKGCNPRAQFTAIDGIREIIPDEFCLHDKLRRVDLCMDNTSRTYDDIAAQLTQHDRVLCIVNTRRDAKEIYTRLPQEGITLHISRMMCPQHVRATIEHVKQALTDDTNKVIRVIATQLIEAGVDIDFPVVYRQESGLDSVLQAAGRCNREGRMDRGVTHVFSLTAERPLPRGNMSDANNARLAMGNDHDWFSPQAMTEYFRQLYFRKETFDKKGMAHYLYSPNAMYIATAAKEFRLIEDNGFSLIVNYGDSPQLVTQLKTEGPSYQLMKKLSMLSVTVHERDKKKMTEAGLVEEVIEGVYFVPDRAQYDDRVGLCTDSHWMEEILIV